VKYIYKLNTQFDGVNKFDVEADNYSLDGEYFHFTESTGTTSRRVASVRASEVFNIERTEKAK